MKKIAITGGILLLVAAIAVPFLGSDTAEGRGKGNWKGSRSGEYGCYEQRLNLNPEQTERLNAMREEHFRQMAPLRNELSKKWAELRGLRSNSGADKATLQAKEKEVAQLKKRIQEKRTQFRAEYNKILTPEQLEQKKSNPQQRGFGRYGDYGRGGCGKGRF